MSYFTTHHFSPRGNQHQHHESEHPPVTALTAPAPTVAAAPGAAATAGGIEAHSAHPHHTGLDVLTRLLHSLGSHPDDGIVSSKDDGFAHPHFDLVETKSAYTVFGELPGLDRGDVTVEVSDHLSTVIVSGDLKRGVPQRIEAKSEPDGSDDIGVLHHEVVTDATPVGAQFKPTLGEERQEAAATPATGEAKKDEEAKGSLADLYWHVAERRVGHFRRAFQFPLGLVETDKVQATMRLGLLTVVVPKVTGPGVEEALKKLAEARKLDVIEGDVSGKVLGGLLF